METSLMLALVVWLASGLAATALAPRNASAWALAVVGACWVLSWRLEGTSGSTLWVDTTFLLGVVGLVGVLVSHPRGTARRSHWYVVGALGVLAVIGPASGELGDPFSAVAWLVLVSEPAWVPLGLVLLVLRYRSAAGPARDELRPLLVGVAVLAAALAMVVGTTVLGAPVPEAVGRPVFLAALATVPVILLWGISRRTRALDRELAASRARLIESEDRARRAIERDLHDGVQQQLVAMLTLTELATRQAGRDPARVAESLGHLREQVVRAIGELRDLVSGIRPPVLEDAGVAAALASRVQRVPTGVSLEAPARSGRRWPPEAEAAAYFVGCEAVTNALKHAPGSEVRIAVTDTDAVLSVEVRDDGPGLGPGGQGQGLAGLRDRVESLGGHFHVGAGSPRGTLVAARFEREARA